MRINFLIPKDSSPRILKLLEESGICQGGAPVLDQAQPASKQLNLNKLSDADGAKSGG